MFPLKRLLRLLLTVTFCSLWLFLVAELRKYQLSAAMSRSPLIQSSPTSCDRYSDYFTDDYTSLKSRLTKQFELKERLATLSNEEITEFSAQHYRNLTIQWSKRGLLPPSKPLYDNQCLSYLDRNYNAQISVVISYQNELAVLIMRTLTTILHRTPLKYLKEILLIDDYSTMNVTEEVMRYVREQRMPVRYLRNHVHLGIAGSRLRGIEEAVGDVVVILDSHMEVSDMWLEPLLQTLEERPGAITVPIVHIILESQYEERGTTREELYVVQPRGGWGYMTLYPHPDPTQDPLVPVPSTSLLGGALAARRDTLMQYYPTSVVRSSWGVENNKLSFRSWMCGQGNWVCPCSQVLHPNGNDLNHHRYFGGAENLRNDVMLESLAEAINFESDVAVKDKLLSKVVSSFDELQKIKNISQHIKKTFNPELRGCKSLKWYLSEVYNNYISWERDQFDQVGEVRSVHNPQMCLTVEDMRVVLNRCKKTPPLLDDVHLTVRMFSCHVSSPNQGHPYSSQWFSYDEDSRQIVHLSSDRCLQYVHSTAVRLLRCIPGRVSQQWEVITSAWF